jgi:hypothetical protein
VDLLRLILLIVLCAATSLGISPAAASDDQDAASPDTATAASPDTAPLPAADTADRIVGPLTFAARTLSPRIRPGAPWWLHLRLAANDHLRSGRLHVTVSEEDHPAAAWTSDPWTITPSMRDSVVVLPAITPGGDGQLTAIFTWLGDDGDIALGTQDLTLPGSADRDLIIALVDPPAAAVDPPWRQLALDRCVPPEERQSHLALHTSLARLTADDVPDQPLAFCAVDLVAIASSEAAHLRQAQVTALATWVRAGGALCVFGAADADDHHDLLPGWLVPGLAPLDSATAAAAASDAAAIRGARCGLGRVVTVPQDSDHDGPGWREATAFLWHLRAKNAETMIATGTWSTASLIGTLGLHMSSDDTLPQPSFSPTISWDCAQGIQNLLIPRGFSGLPWWLLVAICVLFIVLIGPADWLILGRLRRRRWTWVVFPVVALATTAATVATSQAWLGSHDRMRRLDIVVLDRDGKPLRADRFELHLAGHDQDVEVPCHDGILVDATVNLHEQRGYYSPRPDASIPSVIPVTGAFPGDFSARIHLPQWSPVLLHRMDFGANLPPGTLPTWTWPTDPTDPAAWAAIPGGPAVLMWDASHRILRAGPPVVLSVAELRAEPPNGEVLNQLLAEKIPARIFFVAEQTWNFRALAAGIAPAGGLDLNDLPLDHPADGGDDPLVVVVTQTDDGWLILCRPCPRSANATPPTPPRENP